MISQGSFWMTISFIGYTISPKKSRPASTNETQPAEIAAAPTVQKAVRRAKALDRLGNWAGQLESMLLRRLLVVGALGALVMIGLFLSNYSSARAVSYWSAMFPIFGLACLAHELAGGRAYAVALWRILVRQMLHWMGPIIAVKILFLQYARGQMSTDAVALTIILVLAVTCFLAGVHFDGSFYWVSIFLALAVVVGTEIETYIWFASVMVLVVTAIAILSTVLLRRGATRTLSVR
jgi:hypothetical protein